MGLLLNTDAYLLTTTTTTTTTTKKSLIPNKLGYARNET
jgi:hypothetical protein